MKIKCWQIEPYHNNDADFAIFPIEGEESHHKALEYAKDRLEEQWNATAHDPDVKPLVTMEIIEMDEEELELILEEV